MTDVTLMLARWVQGDREALDPLMAAVYTELRRIADSYLRRERSEHTLQPTALVHEAWLRLVHQEGGSFDNRKQFYALAAQVMRRILVDHGRRVRAEKRGGMIEKVSDRDAPDPAAGHLEELLILDEALTKLAQYSQRKAQVIEMRYFGGLSVEEMADVLGVSIATVSREQKMAEAWLGQEMRSDRGGPESSGE